MATPRIRSKHGDENDWSAKNPILMLGEIGTVTSGTNKGNIKVGDGVTRWNDLVYVGSGAVGTKGDKGDKGDTGKTGATGPADTLTGSANAQLQQALGDAANALAQANTAYAAATTGAATAASALSSASAALQGQINSLSTVASAAAAAATAAQNTADGKNKIYRQSTQPSGTLSAGDLWFDTSNGNKISKWSGSAWESFGLGNAAIANLDAGKISTGYLAADRIQANTIDASKITAGAIVADKLAANALYGKTIIGATIGTVDEATGGARIALSTTGLYAYNTSGAPTFSIIASTGNVTSIGGSISGANISSRADGATNASVVLSSQGLYSYDTNGVSRFTLTATTGTVNIVSNGLDGLQFDGANDKISFFKGGVEKASLQSFTEDSYGGISLTNVSGALLYLGNQKIYLSASTSRSSLLLNANATLDSPNKVFIQSGINSIQVSPGGGIEIGQGATGAGGRPDPVFSEAINQNTTSFTGNLYMSSGSGRMYRGQTGSSRTIKNSITDLSIELDPKKLLNIPVRQFKYNTGVITNPDDSRCDTFIPGFIADEVAAVYPIAVDYENGEPIGWNYMYIIPPMLKLIQDQQNTIEELATRVQNLEGINK